MATWPSPPAPVSSGDPVPSVGYNKLIQMSTHLKERLDGLTPFTNSDAGALVAGDVLVQDAASGERMFAKSAASAGAAGPFFVCLGAVAIAGTGYAAHLGFVDLNYTGTAPVAGDQLQASGTAGLAMVGTTNPFATAYADGSGGSVQAILYGLGGASGGGGGGGSSGALLWDPFGVAVPPVATDLSVHDNWAGSGIVTAITQEGDAVVFKNPCSGTTVERGAFGITSGGPYSVPTTGPFTATACFYLNSPIVQNGKASLTLRQSGNDKRIQAGIYLETVTGTLGVKIDGGNWTDFDSLSTTFGTTLWYWGGGPIWLRIRDDNTNCYWEVSRDGQYFQAYSSGGTRSFCTPDQAGITMESFGNGSGAVMSMILLSLSVINTA